MPPRKQPTLTAVLWRGRLARPFLLSKTLRYRCFLENRTGISGQKVKIYRWNAFSYI
jgi:hypothetical protein